MLRFRWLLGRSVFTLGCLLFLWSIGALLVQLVCLLAGTMSDGTTGGHFISQLWTFLWHCGAGIACSFVLIWLGVTVAPEKK